MSSSPFLYALLAAGFIGVTVLALAVVALSGKCTVLGRRVEQSARELERLQRTFARFAPAELVERIVSDGAPAGERREVTVMFADIRGFTRISENLDPALVVEILNGYFSAMSGAIQAHHGHVTRVMGDGIMSTFGALEHNPWHMQDAVEAAVAMRQALDRYNAELRLRGGPQLSFGIGIHSGPVITGLVGSDELLEFTVIGDAVNVASRVEALTRRLEADILITEEVRRRLGERFMMTEMPAEFIKGKTNPIVTWAVKAV